MTTKYPPRNRSNMTTMCINSTHTGNWGGHIGVDRVRLTAHISDNGPRSHQSVQLCLTVTDTVANQPTSPSGGSGYHRPRQWTVVMGCLTKRYVEETMGHRMLHPPSPHPRWHQPHRNFPADMGKTKTPAAYTTQCMMQMGHLWGSHQVALQ